MMKEKEGVSMFGTELLNARQVAEKLGISYTYFFKIRKVVVHIINWVIKGVNIMF